MRSPEPAGCWGSGDAGIPLPCWDMNLLDYVKLLPTYL